MSDAETMLTGRGGLTWAYGMNAVDGCVVAHPVSRRALCMLASLVLLAGAVPCCVSFSVEQITIAVTAVTVLVTFVAVGVFMTRFMLWRLEVAGEDGAEVSGE